VVAGAIGVEEVKLRHYACFYYFKQLLLIYTLKVP
jgi:hypothetical protein